MISKLIIAIASTMTGSVMLFSQGLGSLSEKVKSLAGTGSSAPEGVNEQLSARPFAEKLREKLSEGDPLVRQGLILATVSATGMGPVDVLAELDGGESITAIAENAGSSEEAVLAVYDELVEYVFGTAAESDRLPESIAESRIAWYQGVGRLMIDQPGMQPGFPGLHQLHIAIIAAAARAGDLTRWELQAGLHDCQTLDEIMKENGHSGQEAVNLAMDHFDDLLNRGVESGKLSADQRLEWANYLQDALQDMVTTPGLHLAGKTCTP